MKIGKSLDDIARKDREELIRLRAKLERVQRVMDAWGKPLVKVKSHQYGDMKMFYGELVTALDDESGE